MNRLEERPVVQTLEDYRSLPENPVYFGDVAPGGVEYVPGPEAAHETDSIQQRHRRLSIPTFSNRHRNATRETPGRRAEPAQDPRRPLSEEIFRPRPQVPPEKGAPRR